MGVPTGSSLGAARGSIEISTSQLASARAAVRAFATGVSTDFTGVNTKVKQTEKSLNELGQGVGGLQDRFRKLDSFLGASFLAGAVVGFGKLTFELGQAAAQAELTEKSFERMATGVGQSSDKLLEGMRSASRGVVTDANLIIGANRAIGTNVANTSEELNQILEIARATGQAYGKSTTDAYARIVEAVGKLEPELLDELGITLRLDQVFRSYAASLGTTAAKLTDAQRKQAFLNEIIRQTKDEVDAAKDSNNNAADSYGRMSVAVEKLSKSFGQLINATGGPQLLTGLALLFDVTSAKIQVEINNVRTLTEWWERLSRAKWGAAATPSTGALSGPPAWMTGVSPAASGPLGPDRSAEKAAVKLDWAKGVTEVNEQLHDDIIDAERDFGHTRANTVSEYNKGVAREERDFQRNRLRAEIEHLDSIADIYKDQARRESKAATDLARSLSQSRVDSEERIADARKDANERLAELDEDYQRDREKRARAHRDNLLEAAGRLDAKAVAEANRNFKRQEEDAKEAHDDQRKEIQEALAERIEDEKKSLAKSLAQQQEAHDRQLKEARENDALRLEEMKADFAQRKAEEDEDRAIRLADQAQDHADQLAEMDRAQAERIQQIKDNAAEERAQLEEEANAALQELGVRNKKYDDMMVRRMAHLEKLWDDYMGHIETSLGGRPADRPFGETDAPPGFASGGFVPRDMLARLHAGEVVIPAAQVAAGGMGGRSLSMDGMTLNVYGAPGQSPNDIGQAVRFQLERMLEEIAS